MASRLDRILEGPPRTDVDAPRMGAPKGVPSGSLETQQMGSSPRRSRADTPSAHAQGRTIPRPQPPLATKAGDRAKSLAMGPLTRGRATASSKGEANHRSASPSALHDPLVRCLEPSRGAVRGMPVEVLVGGPFSLCGNVFDIMILIFLCLLCYGLSHAHSSFLRLKRTHEQAQPSMAKRLKAGAASKDTG